MSSTDDDARPRRHDRVWLDPATWRSRLRGTEPDAAALDRVDAWIDGGRACVARRRDADSPTNSCGVAIALPLAAGRTRIAWTVDRRAVVRVAPPLALAEVVDHAPRERRAALRDLQTRADTLGVALHVYGSYAWQAISGEPCVTPGSDLDLLWDAGDAQVARVIAMLSEWEATHGLRADGEARFPDGGAVAWRELAASRVLVKRDDGVAIEASPLSRGTLEATRHR